MVPIKLCFYLLLHFIKLDVIISDDELYKKFYQTDYKVTFGRQSVTYFNESIGKFTLVTSKYNRTHFATNSTFFLNIDLGYDLEVIVQAYKFLSNEYRIFPLRFQYNFCKGFKNNFVGIKTCSEKCGYLNCPLKKNIQYFICNCLSDESKMPPFIPTGSFKLALEGRHKSTIVGTAEIYITIYRPILPGKRSG